MKIYLDIVYLLNSYVGLLSVCSIGVLMGITFSFKKIAFVSCIWGLVVIELYVPYDVLIFLGFSLLAAVILNRRHSLKTFFLWIFLQITYTTSFICFGHAVERRGAVLVVGTSFSWLYAAVLGTIVIGLYLFMLFSLKKQVLKQGLYYEVLIAKGTTRYICHGFMDTGNQAVADGLPVIFTDCLDVKAEKMIQIGHVGQNKMYPAMKVRLYWQSKWQEAYLARTEHLDLENAELLLNLQLF